MNRRQEMFNPPEEYEMIRNLSEGEEKERRKQAFHEKRVEQKTLIATTAALLIERVTENPDLTDHELRDIVREFTPEMKLSGPQNRMFNEMINAFRRRRKAMIALQAFSNEPNKIFQKKFGRSPKGSVKVMFGPIVTHFILSNEDYEIVAQERKNELGVPLKSGGQFMPLRPDITIGRATGWNKSDEAVRKHEETHALKHMLDEILGLDRFDRSFIKKLQHLRQQLEAAKNPNTKAYIAEQILTAYIDKNGERIKDEIFANIRADEKKNIVETLSRSSRHLGLYDYSERDRKQLLEFVETNIGPAERILVEEVIKNFSSLNKSRIKKAADAVSILVHKHNFTAEMILFFLNDVPLALWGKEVARLNGSGQP